MKKILPQPWSEHVKPLMDLLRELRAKKMWETTVALNPDRPYKADIIIQYWVIGKESCLVRIYTDGGGWDVYSPITDEQDINTALALIRIKLQPPVPLTESDLDALAILVDKALDDAYHYGLSEPGTFGHYACRGSAKACARQLALDTTDIEDLAKAVHEGWGNAVYSFIDQPPEKKAKRLALATTPYAELSNDEQEKDRVVARVLLQAWAARP